MHLDGFTDRLDMAEQFNEGERSGKDRVFTPKHDFPTDDELIVGIYHLDSYDGDAFVLYKRDGKYFEVNGGHCSCFGLEDQWKPEETSLEAIIMNKDSYGARGIAKPYVIALKEAN